MSAATADLPTAEFLQAELLDMAAAAKFAGIGLATLNRRVIAGTFPEPIRIGSGRRPSPFWRRSDLQAWKESRAT